MEDFRKAMIKWAQSWNRSNIGQQRVASAVEILKKDIFSADSNEWIAYGNEIRVRLESSLKSVVQISQRISDASVELFGRAGDWQESALKIVSADEQNRILDLICGTESDRRNSLVDAIVIFTLKQCLGGLPEELQPVASILDAFTEQSCLPPAKYYSWDSTKYYYDSERVREFQSIVESLIEKAGEVESACQAQGEYKRIADLATQCRVIGEAIAKRLEKNSVGWPVEITGHLAALEHPTEHLREICKDKDISKQATEVRYTFMHLNAFWQPQECTSYRLNGQSAGTNTSTRKEHDLPSNAQDSVAVESVDSEKHFENTDDDATDTEPAESELHQAEEPSHVAAAYDAPTGIESMPTDFAQVSSGEALADIDEADLASMETNESEDSESDDVLTLTVLANQLDLITESRERISSTAESIAAITSELERLGSDLNKRYRSVRKRSTSLDENWATDAAKIERSKEKIIGFLNDIFRWANNHQNEVLTTLSRLDTTESKTANLISRMDQHAENLNQQTHLINRLNIISDHVNEIWTSLGFQDEERDSKKSMLNLFGKGEHEPTRDRMADALLKQLFGPDVIHRFVDAYNQSVAHDGSQLVYERLPDLFDDLDTFVGAMSSSLESDVFDCQIVEELVKQLDERFVGWRKRLNIECIGQVGDTYDRRYHQKKQTKITSDEDQDETIYEVVRLGYGQMVDGELVLIRPAYVHVYVKAEQRSDEQ